MTTATLPPPDEMYRALLERDPAYEGIFFVAVRTTGIFCRPTCPARKPARRNVEFHPTVQEAMLAGYRPCKRCRPLEPRGRTPDWLRPLLEEAESSPELRLRDQDLRARGLDPVRVRRWFQGEHGMTFQAWQRSRRLGRALGRLRHGDDLTATAFDAGFESLSGFREAFQRLAGEAPGRGRHTPRLWVTRVLTPLGPMVAGATEEALCMLEFADRRMLETQLRRLQRRMGFVPVPGSNPLIARLDQELRAYFEGRLQEFTVPVHAPGTPFQEAVWEALRTISYGTTESYQGLARRVGRATAVRAVGRANGDNPVAVVIPCHRVVGADGRLTGYGGGLRRKQFLLDLERNGAGA